MAKSNFDFQLARVPFRRLPVFFRLSYVSRDTRAQVQKIIGAAFRQGALPESRRVPHFLIVDEFPRFVNNRAAAFDQILAEARRYKLSLVIASQYVDQLDPSMRAAIFGNVGALIAFRVGHKDARLLADEFSGSSVDDFTELRVGRCVARIGTDWNVVRTPPPPTVNADTPSPMIAESEPVASEEHPTDDSPTDDDELVQ